MVIENPQKHFNSFLGKSLLGKTAINSPKNNAQIPKNLPKFILGNRFWGNAGYSANKEDVYEEKEFQRTM